MKLFVTFTKQNPDFDKEYAKDFHQGKESDNNRKLAWSYGHKLEAEIDKIQVTESGDIGIDIKKENGKSEYSIFHNMTILDCMQNGMNKGRFAVSKELLLKTQKTPNVKYDTMRFYFYLKSRNDFVRIGDNFYVLLEDVPDSGRK